MAKTLTTNPELHNVFGTLKPEIRARLKAVLDNPAANWDDAYSICLKGFKTLWQFVVIVDPTFQKTRTGAGWSRYPDQLTIAKALKLATAGR